MKRQNGESFNFMKYFVVADVHGYYYELINALNEKGFDPGNADHKLVVCGDLLDRGPDAVQMQSYILDLMAKDKVVLIKGNHEDLMLDFIDNIEFYSYGFYHTHHYSNRTVDSAEQLTGLGDFDILDHPKEFAEKVRETPFVSTIIPAMKDYFETEHYIFVHGWIPCFGDKQNRNFAYNPEWRSADADAWEAARWYNGMELAHKYKVVEPGKTIVCGHWHCSWGWANIKQERKEFPQKNKMGWEKSFEPYAEEGILALDACTAHTGIINVAVLED